MKQEAILVGYSGHGYVVAEAAKSIGFEIMGYFDIEEKQNNPFHLKYLGNDHDEKTIETYKGSQVIMGIGENQIREKVSQLLKAAGFQFPKIVHHGASVAFDADIATGTMVMRGVSINSFTQIGKQVIVNTSAVVEHECQVSDYAHLAPGSVLLGNVSVGKSSFIGANAVVKQGVTIGANVTIGTGAVVLNDIADNQTWVGNPARRLK